MFRVAANPLGCGLGSLGQARQTGRQKKEDLLLALCPEFVKLKQTASAMSSGSSSNAARNGVKQSLQAKGPRTPSANRLAVAERGVGARVERGEAAPVEAPYAHSTRAWRSGGDRKIMFDNRGEPALGGSNQQAAPSLVTASSIIPVVLLLYCSSTAVAVRQVH